MPVSDNHKYHEEHADTALRSINNVFFWFRSPLYLVEVGRSIQLFFLSLRCAHFFRFRWSCTKANSQFFCAIIRATVSHTFVHTNRCVWFFVFNRLELTNTAAENFAWRFSCSAVRRLRVLVCVFRYEKHRMSAKEKARKRKLVLSLLYSVPLSLIFFSRMHTVCSYVNDAISSKMHKWRAIKIRNHSHWKCTFRRLRFHSDCQMLGNVKMHVAYIKR